MGSDAVLEGCAVAADVAEEIAQLQVHPLDVLLEVVLAGDEQAALVAHLLRVIVVDLHVRAKSLRGEENLRAALDGTGNLRLHRRVHDGDVVAEGSRPAERCVAVLAEPLRAVLLGHMHFDFVRVERLIRLEDGRAVVALIGLAEARVEPPAVTLQRTFGDRHEVTLVARVAGALFRRDMSQHLRKKFQNFKF